MELEQRETVLRGAFLLGMTDEGESQCNAVHSKSVCACVRGKENESRADGTAIDSGLLQLEVHFGV